MKFIKSKKALVLLAVTVAAVAAAVAGYAYWTASGSGAGTAATGSITSGITVNQNSVVSGLYPGGPAQTLSGDFSNSNNSPAYVTSVTASLSSVDGGSDSSKPACTTADFQLSNATMSVGQDIPGRAGYDSNVTAGSWSGATVALKDTADNQDNCKNATLHISYTSN